MEIGEKIKALRKSKGMTQKALAEKAGVSASAITYYEKGERIPSALALKAISCALDIDISCFYENTNNKALVFNSREEATQLLFNILGYKIITDTALEGNSVIQICKGDIIHNIDIYNYAKIINDEIPFLLEYLLSIHDIKRQEAAAGASTEKE